MRPNMNKSVIKVLLATLLSMTSLFSVIASADANLGTYSSIAPMIFVAKRAVLTVDVEREVRLLCGQTKNLNPDLVRYGLIAYNNAVRMGITRRKVITLIDFTVVSTQPRFWVIDLETHRVLFSELVAHGQHSGESKATSFSNIN